MIKSRKSILFLCITLNIFLAALIYNQIVEATGGAFPKTKMGGGLDEGEGNVGVDRSSNTGSLSLGRNAVPEYSVYEPGECNHCHELHASFGGEEPKPKDGGPHPYLTFKNAQEDKTGSDFCLYCHDQFDFGTITYSSDGTTVGDPPQGFGVHGVFQNGPNLNVYKNSSHYTSNAFLWPEPSQSRPGGGYIEPSPTIHPRKIRSKGRGTCLNCHTPHGIMGKAGGDQYIYDEDAVKGSIQSQISQGGIHPDTGRPLKGDITTPYLIPRQKIAWEEALCENCHDAGGSAVSTLPPNIQDEIDKRITPSCGNGDTFPYNDSCGSGHPVDDPLYAGQHSTREAVEVTERHVECYDCHNPHGVRGPNTPSTVADDGGRMTGTKYVEIDGTQHIAGVDGARQPYVYEVCFRCHGDTFVYVSRGAEQAAPSPYVAAGSETGPGSGTPDPSSIVDLGDYNGNVTARFRGNENITGSINEQLGWSNKRREFNPNTSNTTFNQSTLKSAFHPVVEEGRNQSEALNWSLSEPFSSTKLGIVSASSGLSTSATINCNDCHNNEDVGGGVPYDINTGVRGPLNESNLRDTDVQTSYSGAAPVGPHGSKNPRILRAYYNTYIETNNSSNYEEHKYNNSGFAYAGPHRVERVNDYYSFWCRGNHNNPTEILNNFALCFSCHNPEPFLYGRDAGAPPTDKNGKRLPANDCRVDPTGAGDGRNGLKTWGECYDWRSDTWVPCEYLTSGPNGDGLEENQHTNFWTPGWGFGSLHYYHLKTGKIKCHECHYNVHSNVEATNTLYDNPNALGTGVPPDGNTHLINFAPHVQAKDGTKPAWYWDPDPTVTQLQANYPDNTKLQGVFRCNLVCHGRTMADCYYTPPNHYPDSVVRFTTYGGDAIDNTPGPHASGGWVAGTSLYGYWQFWSQCAVSLVQADRPYP